MEMFVMRLTIVIDEYPFDRYKTADEIIEENKVKVSNHGYRNTSIQIK